MNAKEVTYHIGDNIHKQPIKLVRRMQYGTYGPWEWVIERKQCDARDTEASIGGLSDANMRDLIAAFNDHNKR